MYGFYFAGTKKKDETVLLINMSVREQEKEGSRWEWGVTSRNHHHTSYKTYYMEGRGRGSVLIYSSSTTLQFNEII